MSPDMQPTARWYLIQSKPREDQRALGHLERQGFLCYRPTHTVERIRYDCRQALTESLFPGYFFIHLDRVRDNWHPIRFTRGVTRIVSFGNEPIPVADELIAGLRARVDDAESVPYLVPGDRVLITEGPFAELEAIFVSTDGGERVTILLTLMQKDQALSFPVEIIRKRTM